MIAPAALLPLVTVVGALMQAPQAQVSVRALARSGSEAALASRAREAPDEVRAALRDMLVGTVVRSDSADDYLADARRVAHAYWAAWRDSFLVRQVTRFASWSPAQRSLKVSADSLRLAGNSALGRLGVAAALRAWRASLLRCETLGDSAGVGAALGNIGAGFYAAGELDSAAANFGRARDVAEAIGDLRTLGNAVGALANVSRDRGELRRAGELYALAADIRERTGDTRGTAADRNNLGQVAQQLGDLDRARQAFAEALALNRRESRAEPAALNLVNLGNVASVEGEYAQAAAHYREALAIYRDVGNRVGEALVLHDLGLLALRRGDYPGAIALLMDAVRIYEVTGPAAEVVAVRRSLTEARAAEGDLAGALGELRRAERSAAAESGGALAADLALTRADLALQFNRLAEAARLYARAEVLYRRAGRAAGRADALQGRGVIQLLHGRDDSALVVLRLAQRAQESAGDPRPVALTRLLVSYAQQRSGDTAGARRLLTLALDTLRSLGDAVGEAGAWLALGDLEVQEGMFVAAEGMYQRGLARLGGRPARGVSWQLHAGLGRALRGRGALAEAARELRAAADEVERVAGPLAPEDRRADYLADKWEVYAELALVEHDRGLDASAFEASERMRARQMLDLLARGRVTPAEVGDSLTAREQDLRRRIAELTRRLEQTDADAGSALRGPGLAASNALREALAAAQQAYVDLLGELRDGQPELSALVRADVVPAGEVSPRLAADEVLLEYLVADSTTLVFAVTRDTIAVVDLDIGHQELATLVDFARGTLTGPRRPAARQVWRSALRRLYHTLIAPVEVAGLLQDKRVLLIAPHAELHYLPFAALLRRGETDQFLIERYDVAYVPSASVWARLAARRTDPAPGVLALAPRVGVLPGSRAEVAAIARVYGDRAQVLLGPGATERALREAAGRSGIVHLATYGVLNKHNPLFSFVELAGDGADDGRLEVQEVFGLRLNARLVVLSACQTALASGALSDVPPGDDWVGLVRAFLYAGASNVLATLWSVEDVATARLMERFYSSLAAGRAEAAAIAEAQRSMLRNPETTHPFYWAGFALVGGR